jgi:uncharacterized coiled-coil protein SlyX
MARLIKILAAAVGGGLILGAGIRFMEAMVRSAGDAPATPPDRLLTRLDLLENRLVHIERGTSGHATPFAAGAASDGGQVDFTALRSRLDSQQAEVEAIRARISTAETGFGDLGGNGERFRAELRQWMDESVNRRIAAIEEKLRTDIETSQIGTLDAFVDSVQQKVIQRISRLEDEVAGQSAAMSELRECSLQTERSMQKLLEGIDRLVGAQARTAAVAEVSRPARSAAPLPPPEPPAMPAPGPVHLGTAPEDKPRARRWGLFA